jgi:hypothetical protein
MEIDYKNQIDNYVEKITDFKSSLDDQKIIDLLREKNIYSRYFNSKQGIYWKGADVCVCTKKPEYLGQDITICVTEHALLLAIIMFKVRDLDRNVIDYYNKYYFYESIATSVNRLYQSIEPSNSITAMMVASEAINGAIDALINFMELFGYEN